jgi:hypothetical protein
MNSSSFHDYALRCSLRHEVGTTSLARGGTDLVLLSFPGSPQTSFSTQNALLDKLSEPPLQ